MILRHITAAFLFFLVGMVAMFAFGWNQVEQARERDRKAAFEDCHDGNERSDALRSTFINARSLSLRAPPHRVGLTPEQAQRLREDQIRFYEEEIARIPFRDCVTYERYSKPAPLVETATLPGS